MMSEPRQHSYIPKLKQQFAEGRCSRREFLRTSTLLGLSASAAYAFVGKVTGESFVAPARAEMPKGGKMKIGMDVQELSAPQACRNCGQQTRTRTCRADGCSWSDWSDWGACTGQGPCAPNLPAVDTESCGACGGERTRTRACTPSCQWPAWSAWGECIECDSGDGLTMCNEDLNACECNLNSCGDGQKCCTQSDPDIANYCAPQNQLCLSGGGGYGDPCLFFDECDVGLICCFSTNTCLPEFKCDGIIPK